MCFLAVCHWKDHPPSREKLNIPFGSDVVHFKASLDIHAVPHIKALTPGPLLPQWDGASPSPCALYVAFTHRTLASKDCCFSFLYINQLCISYFTFPWCLPKTMQHLRFPNLHPVFLCTGILQLVLRMTHKNNSVCIFFNIPVKPKQLTSEVFYILVMLSYQACGNFRSTFWKQEEIRKGQDLGKGS